MVKLNIFYILYLQIVQSHIRVTPKQQSDQSHHSLHSTCPLMATPCLMIPNPDQARQNVGPNLNPKCLELMVFLKELFEKVNFEFFYENDKKSFPSNQHMQ